MTQLLFSRTSGWITLTALIVFSPQLSGCDTSAPSQRDARVVATPGKQDTSKAPEVKTALPEKNESAMIEKGAVPKEAVAAPKENTIQEETKSADAAIADASAPVVKRLVIASDVEAREPIELHEGKVAEPIVAFLELKNESDAQTGVVITFEHETGKKVGYIELNVPAGSPRYRTWGRTRSIQEPGEWTAVVRTTSGEELARQAFTVRS